MKTIIERAREADLIDDTYASDWYVFQLQRFAELAFEQGRQEGVKQERALWTLTKLGQEIEAQPVQEPVAWRRREVGGYWQYFGWKEADMSHEFVERWNKDGFECEAIPPLPVQPERPWVGLTDEDIKDCLGPLAVRVPEGWRKVTRAIEAKLKEKNA